MNGAGGFLARWRHRRDQRLCREAGERIQEIVDGELPDDRERRRLTRHIEGCRACCAEEETIEQLKEAVARVGTEPDAAVKQRLTSLLDDIRCGRLLPPVDDDPA